MSSPFEARALAAKHTGAAALVAWHAPSYSSGRNDMHSLDITSAVLALFAMALILAIAEFATRSVRHTTTANDAATGKIKAHLDAKLSSKGLAGLVVQALVDSKLVAADKAHEAIEVAARRIDLRKALGDY